MKPWRGRGRNQKRFLNDSCVINLCARLCNSTKVVDQIGLRHTNSRIADGKDLVLLVRDDANKKFLLSIKSRGISQ